MGARNAGHTVVRRGNALNLLVLAGASALVGAAVAKELGQPAEDRTWHGRIAGLPYDFRPPTLDRIRAEFWNPDNDSLLTPHAFGIGYGLNFARLARELSPREP
jgi:hypothetical protein